MGEASNGVEAVTLARELSPDIMMLDLAIPGSSGLEVLQEVRALSPPISAIVLTAAIDKTAIARALQLGARGIVLKDASADQIIESIRTVLKGQYWVDREAVSDLVQVLQGFMPRRAPTHMNFGLSAREMEVVEAITAGYSNREIAQKLGLSEQTVKHHVTNIFDKLGLSNRMELVLFAVSHHLVDEV
jgi:two-component system nitrate/nitrite response regulator NarL